MTLSDIILFSFNHVVTLQIYLLIPFWCASPHLLVIFVFATQSLFKGTVC